MSFSKEDACCMQKKYYVEAFNKVFDNLNEIV